MLARFPERIRLWAAAAAMAAVVAGLSAVSHPSHAAVAGDPVCPQPATTEAIAEPGRLITKFDLTVFRSEFENRRRVLDVVYKLAGEVRIDLNRMPGRYGALVERVARDLSCLTGLRMYIHEEGSRPVSKISLVLRKRSELDALARREKIGAETLKDLLFCYTVPSLYIELPGVNEFAISIVDDFSEVERHHCLVKMMAFALGLFADSDVVQPSIFSPDGAELDYLPINDKIILRTLYDPRIEHGMKREDAMDIAGEIIPGLVKAVRERGVEALYQR